jgi:hypothetical protein
MRARPVRLLKGAVFVSVVAGLVLTAGPAWAHPGGTGETDAEHAAQDLVGTPITQIEKSTRANAAKLAQTTGVTPGRRSTATTSSGVERRAAAAAVDPGQGGKWSAVVNTPVVPIFQAVLPNGKVLMWDSVGDGAAESYPDQTFTRAMVWNPANNTFVRVDLQGYNIFCAGYTQLANGNVLVAGGNKNQDLEGIVQTHLFDWQTQTWSRGPDMADGRWYPSVTALANGEASIVGGGPNVAEVYQTDQTIRQLPSFSSYGDRIYPFMLSRPDTQLQILGPYTRMFTANTAGQGRVNGQENRDGIFRDYGSFATYDVGKTLVAGGGNLTEDGQDNVPTRTASIVDTNGYYTTTTSAASMAVPRRQFSLTVLADGSVLATGGEKKAVDGLVDLDNPVFAAEQWKPATNTWTTLASASRVRQYHSSATLLPDGRVMTGGGGVCGDCTTKGYLEKNVEYFTPPYLYKNDGSGQLATRPVISSGSSTVTAGLKFTITTAQAASIAKVGMVRLGAATHGDDQSQRYIPLTFTAGSGSLTVNPVMNTGVTPPGYYMVFIIDGAGVPSKARIVKVVPGTPPANSRVRQVQSSKCIDVAGSRTADGTPTQLYPCSPAGTNQQWTYSVDYASMSSIGTCLHMSGDRHVVGTRVDVAGCDPTEWQQFERRPGDGTIRPVEANTLCLGVVGRSVANSARLELQTCDGTTSQRWTW